MFLRIGERILNTAHIVEVRISPAHGDRPATDEEIVSYDLEENAVFTARPLSVEITTDATFGGFDFQAEGEIRLFVIRLTGEEAELFLAALPVYEPVLETEER